MKKPFGYLFPKEKLVTSIPSVSFVPSDDAIDLDEDLYYWLQLALDFNPLAKASKKRKSSKN